MLIPLSAGSLSALCFVFSWRAFQRCRAITSASATPPTSAARSTTEAREAREAGRDPPSHETEDPPSHETEDPPSHETDAFEQRLAERESNAALNLAKRNVKGLAQAAFTGGLGLFFLAMTGGQGHHREAVEAFTLGSVGAIACLALRRRIGSRADVWRAAANKRLRRQGVDPLERTG